MRITIGSRLGHYEIVSALGAGGMGEVYRARDTRLDRDVAIKLLPESVAGDRERIDRFRREAKVLASLSHESIGKIFGLEEFEGSTGLVLELLDGESLAERLTRGPLGVPEALEVGRQVADALEAAHSLGVIHRDLKPANIQLTSAGAKVLDFGLAKIRDNAGPSDGGSPADTPTVGLSAASTSPGFILGTAGYMSPEQARGDVVDRRADIWSFGVVLFEALTGRTLFRRDTVVDSIGAILHRDPDWSALPSDTPPLVTLLLRRCLRRDVDRRLHDIGDARADLEAAISDPTSRELMLLHGGSGGSGGSGASRTSRRTIAIFGAVLIATGLAIGWGVRGSGQPAPTPPMIRFSIDLAEQGLTLDTEYSNLALDPTGSKIAFSAKRDAEPSIFLRPLASSGAARALPGTEGGRYPFFSPDGKWIGFLRDRTLMRVPTDGGPALTICELNDFYADPAWLDDGRIVFVGATSLEIVTLDGRIETLAASEFGGVTAPREQLVLGFDNPARVPGASYVLASVYDGASIEDYDVVAVSLDNGSVRQVVANATQPQFLPPDHLTFSRETSLFIVPFDPRRGVVTGDPVLAVDGVMTNLWADNVQYASASRGTLAYIPGRRRGPGRKLVRVDETGRSRALLETAEALTGSIRVSPDGEKLVLTTLRRKMELWSLDLDSRLLTLLSNVAPAYSPVWMPDSREVIYQRESLMGSTAPTTLIRQPADGSGSGTVIEFDGSTGFEWPATVSEDGTSVLLCANDPTASNRHDILLLELGANGPARPLISTSADEHSPTMSRDGGYVAYQSDESGRDEIYVRRLPDTGERWQVTVEGGRDPRWSWAGDRLYFYGRDALVVSWIHTETGFESDPPEKLFDLDGVTLDSFQYDVLPDEDFVMVEPAPWEVPRPRIEVVVHWDRSSLQD